MWLLDRFKAKAPATHQYGLYEKETVKQYSVEQLRSMLHGLQWSDFHYRQKHDKRFYYDAVHNVHFMAYFEKGESKRPSIRVKAQGQDVVFKFIKEDQYKLHTSKQPIAMSGRAIWCELNELGPVVPSDE